jgi:hypothetical protein
MPPYPRSIYGTHSRSQGGLIGFAALLSFVTAVPPLVTGNYVIAALCAAGGIALAVCAERADQERRQREETYTRGVELEAEILARYEAGEPPGSELAKLRQTMGSANDPLELELRYVVDGREIVSRGEVPVDIFFRARGMKTLKIKIRPDCPEDWVALG